MLIAKVLANLLGNALRRTRTNVHVEMMTSQHRVTISVSDDGEGIPVDEIERIFERFHRIDPARRSSARSGSGLGLTIARAIVTEHGGTSAPARAAGPISTSP